MPSGQTAGEALSDSQIAQALNASLATIARTRQQLFEEGFDAVLTHNQLDVTLPSAGCVRQSEGANQPPRSAPVDID